MNSKIPSNLGLIILYLFLVLTLKYFYEFLKHTEKYTNNTVTDKHLTVRFKPLAMFVQDSNKLSADLCVCVN